MIDFSDAKVVAALTKTLLLHDFQLSVKIPDDDSYLCPPVPNRVNYVCWVSDLVDHNFNRLRNDQSNKLVADIGVGPLAIYSLLGATLFDMHFIGSDINSDALTIAKNNVAENALTDKITLFLVPDCNKYQQLIASCYLPSLERKLVSEYALSKMMISAEHLPRGPLLTLLAKYNPSTVTLLEERFRRCQLQQEWNSINILSLLDAVMTNPPFYSDDEQVLKLIVHFKIFQIIVPDLLIDLRKQEYCLHWQ